MPVELSSQKAADIFGIYITISNLFIAHIISLCATSVGIQVPKTEEANGKQKCSEGISHHY
jgi:hypothetical protein